MNKEGLVGLVTSAMRDKNIRKPVRAQKSTFHISDDDGNAKDFVVSSSDRSVIFTVDDVKAVIDTCLQVIEEALCRGETISLRGFGELGLKYRAPRKTKKPETDEWVDISGRYVPRFRFGNTLRMAARVYQMSLEDQGLHRDLPVFDDDDDEFFLNEREPLDTEDYDAD